MFRSIICNIPLVVIALGSLMVFACLSGREELELLAWFLYGIWSLFYIYIEIKNKKQQCSKSANSPCPVKKSMFSC